MSDLNTQRKGKSSEPKCCIRDPLWLTWETIFCVRGDVLSPLMCWHKGKSDSRQKELVWDVVAF